MNIVRKLLMQGALLTFVSALGVAGCATVADDEAERGDDVADVGDEEAAEPGETAQALGCPYRSSRYENVYVGWKDGHKTYCTGGRYHPPCDAVQQRRTGTRLQYRVGKVTRLGVWVATGGWRYC